MILRQQPQVGVAADQAAQQGRRFAAGGNRRVQLAHRVKLRGEDHPRQELLDSVGKGRVAVPLVGLAREARFLEHVQTSFVRESFSASAAR